LPGAKTKSQKHKINHFRRKEALRRLGAKTKSWKSKLNCFGRNEAPKG
jgi:hypothetical protein